MLEGYCLLQMNGSVCGRIQAEVVQSCDESLGSCKSREAERTVTALEGKRGEIKLRWWEEEAVVCPLVDNVCPLFQGK